MHSYESVLSQLNSLGIRHGRVFQGEVKALARLLLPDEQIEQFMTGRYDAGPAILVATNRRLLLVDKKPFNLTIEDIPYDMVSEVEYSMQAFNATIAVHSISKTINMMSFRQTLLRRFAGFVQARVMHIRANTQSAQNPAQRMSYMQAASFQTPEVRPSTGQAITPAQYSYPRTRQ